MADDVLSEGHQIAAMGKKGQRDIGYLGIAKEFCHHPVGFQ